MEECKFKDFEIMIGRNLIMVTFIDKNSLKWFKYKKKKDISLNDFIKDLVDLISLK